MKEFFGEEKKKGKMITTIYVRIDQKFIKKWIRQNKKGFLIFRYLYFFSGLDIIMKYDRIFQQKYQFEIFNVGKMIKWEFN